MNILFMSFCTLIYSFLWEIFLGISIGNTCAQIQEILEQNCKTQNSGLRPKEEKPHDPINQPSRCNTQEGLLSVAQTGDSDLLGGRAHRTANWVSFICSMLHTGYKVIGYMFAKQSYCCKRRGLFFKLRRPRAFQLSRGLFTGCTLIGRLQVTLWGRGIPPFHGKPKPKSWPPISPSPGSPT